MNKSAWKVKMLSLPYSVWAAIFIIVPLCMVFFYGFTDKTGAFTFDNILAIGQYEHLKGLFLALGLSLIATITCIVLAYPLALILNSNKKNAHSIVVFIFILPMWMNFLLRTMAWQNILENNGVINTLLSYIGIGPVKLINTSGAIILGMVYNFLPFMILPIFNSISKIDTNVINAAKDLGANNKQVFTKVILPLSIPGVISGTTMVFIPALTTFVISKLLGGSKILLIGNIIEEEFTQASNWNLGSGLSCVLMIFIIVSMVISSIFDKEGEANYL